MKIYVASSWRNERQPRIVQALRNAGHEVYDFRRPAADDAGFSWSEIDPAWQRWTPDEFRRALQHPTAKRGFRFDYTAMIWADACVLVGPCGRSAHLELGWCAGAGKRTVILLASGDEPELMYKLATSICTTVEEVIEALR